MIKSTINSTNLNQILKNAIEYSDGFIEGVEMEKIEFHRILGGYATEALGKYIDAKARMAPHTLHHVYEWDAVGQESSRLFNFNVNATKTNIIITGKFLPSKTISRNSHVPFPDKANMMENSIEIIIKPKNSDVLAFENDGEMVFTRNTIYIDHPGGDEVAGSFGKTVDDFFNNYFKNSLLKGFLDQLSTAKQFSEDFAAGTKSGKSVGVRAGRKYLHVSGVTIE
jgi:hypothetical protein